MSERTVQAESETTPEAPALSYRIEEHAGSTVVTFSGEVDENADFSELKQRLAARSPLVFELGDIRRINSCGVREWVNFVRELGQLGSSDLSFVACSPAIVTQLNMIYNFRGPAKVRSFLAPYVCSGCDHETEILLEVSTHFPGRLRQPPAFACERCAAPLEFDDLPERYFSFLNDA
jgi:anti-anti-sigma regulatory factor